MNPLDREPALTLAVVQALLALVLAFGVDLTVEQTGAILAVTAAALGYATRQQVTPVKHPSIDDQHGDQQ